MMNSISEYLIKDTQCILDALRLLNSMNKGSARTLFVINEDNEMIGTLTDGDIRRKLVEGYDTTSVVSQLMHKEFCYLQNNEISVSEIHKAKEKGISLLPVLNRQKKIVDIINLNIYKSYLPIDAVLMAGGKGERLRPLTEKTPKPLVKVGDKAIIDYNIERLISYGLKNISVTVNYLGEQLEEHFSTPKNGVKVSCNREPKYLGTIGSIRFVKEFHNDTILVMNSDLFTNIDYEDFYLHFKEHDAEMSVAAVPYTVSVPYGIFELDGRNIQGVKEKPTYNYYANAGIYLIKKSALKHIPEDKFFNATDLIDELVKQRLKVIRYPIPGYWIDIGQHSELKKAEELVLHIK